MPAQYEAILASLRKEYPDTPLKKLKGMAARIYNAKRPKGAPPVGPHYDEKHGKGKKR